MFRMLGAAVAALLLSLPAVGFAASPLASFRSIGEAPIFRYDDSPPHGFDVDTITPPGEVNVMFSWLRSSDWAHPKYDFINDFVALGELPAIFTLTADPNPFPTGKSDASGTYSLVYAGPQITANGKTFNAGDRLLYGYIAFDGPPWSYAQSDFFDNGPSIDYFNFELVNPTTSGPITAGGLRAEFFASVPEPATWAMMIIGFGLVGTTVRRRRASFGPDRRALCAPL